MAARLSLISNSFLLVKVRFAFEGDWKAEEDNVAVGSSPVAAAPAAVDAEVVVFPHILMKSCLTVPSLEHSPNLKTTSSRDLNTLASRTPYTSLSGWVCFDNHDVEKSIFFWSRDSLALEEDGSGCGNCSFWEDDSEPVFDAFSSGLCLEILFLQLIDYLV